MIIHVVQQGETIQTIADKYKLPARYLIEQNGITNENDLLVGQTIVVIYPKEVHTVKEGDTLTSIAKMYNVDIMQILRNNPNILDRVLKPGEIVIISYDSIKEGEIAITGYAYPYIDRDILKKTLPYLSYLTVFNYQILEGGVINDIDDNEVVELARSYGVAPLMFIAVLNESGVSKPDVAFSLLSNEKEQITLIESIMATLRRKKYTGINIYLQYLEQSNLSLEEKLVKRLSDQLHKEGYRFAVTITPKVRTEGNQAPFLEKIDYSVIVQYVDAVLFSAYEWGYSFGPPASVTPVNYLKIYLDYVTSIVPTEKIFLGMPIIGYNWELPYVPGASRASALTTSAAIELAVSHDVKISYNEVSEAPYYFYYMENKELHIVWFKDARSIEAFTDLLVKYKLFGVSIWNVMQFFTQMWTIMNNKFDIRKDPNVKSDKI